MNKTGATIQTSCVFAAHIAKNTMGMQRMVAMQTQSRGGIGCLQHFDRVVIGPRLRRLTILPMSSAALRALAVAGLNPPTSTNQVQGGFVKILDLGGEMDWRSTKSSFWFILLSNGVKLKFSVKRVKFGKKSNFYHISPFCDMFSEPLCRTPIQKPVPRTFRCEPGQ